MIQVKYYCGTCGIEIIEKASFNKKHPSTLAVPVVWHECNDKYIVPLQSTVDTVTDEPVQKKDLK